MLPTPYRGAFLRNHPMHDIKAIRDNPDAFDKGLARRGLPPIAQELVELDKQWREYTGQFQAAQARANTAAKEIGAAVRSGDRDAVDRAKATPSQDKAKIFEFEQNARDYHENVMRRLAVIPNLPLDEVPDGNDEHGNIEAPR